jgi:hypothetical protein
MTQQVQQGIAVRFCTTTIVVLLVQISEGSFTHLQKESTVSRKPEKHKSVANGAASRYADETGSLLGVCSRDCAPRKGGLL